MESNGHIGTPAPRERVWGPDARLDESVTFEEYQYWAKEERALEMEENRIYHAERGSRTILSTLKGRFSKGVHQENAERDRKGTELKGYAPSDEKNPKDVVTQDAGGADTSVIGADVMVASHTEWRDASRALRTASWGSIFYLVTTDILGWSGAPYVFASVGFGPGVALYVVFGVAAGFSGWILYKVFLGLDSARYPMSSFGDPFFRVFGKKTRHAINIMQSIQQFMSVAVLVLGQASIIAQIANAKICFIVTMVIVIVIGMVLGTIRSLQRLSWLCNASVWLNIINFIIILVAASKYPPAYDTIFAQTVLPKQVMPKRTFAGPPPPLYQLQSRVEFSAQFNAVDTMVYAYSGLILFVAFLAEMRQPMDFIKGMFCAQVFIAIVYIIFGAVVYAEVGQYMVSQIGQSITPYSVQTAGNVLGLLTGFIAIVLYFNVCMKTIYLEVFQAIFDFPPITTQRGKWFWFALGPILWILAFIVAASVPNLNGIVNVVGGLFSLNFTYSIPAVLWLGYSVKDASKLEGEGFDPVSGETTRLSSGYMRYVRGYVKRPVSHTITLLYFLAGLACSGMGTWAAIEGLISVFGPGGTVATSWGCASPVA
ncbi:hypothetical protein LTR62_003199 [Meristemomyces frigidus]|uniref:Amino acid transporter transmembrane domain-containing protein n=1 Tax=Meristemomyces frigidus TaxID=1508187 RepID=A0AAN7TL56_9PEZI|nr:hypothetical protein LTR62_003199 [Meristemomyces frigidus]